MHFLSMISIQPSGQKRSHIPQPMHLSLSTMGLKVRHVPVLFIVVLPTSVIIPPGMCFFVMSIIYLRLLYTSLAANMFVSAIFFGMFSLMAASIDSIVISPVAFENAPSIGVFTKGFPIMSSAIFVMSSVFTVKSPLSPSSSGVFDELIINMPPFFMPSVTSTTPVRVASRTST